MEAKLVGQLGVARMTLVGGPHDGEHRIAVIGAPVVVPIREAPAKPAQQSSGFLFASWAPVTIEGDEWKNQAEKAEAGKCSARFGVYAPETRDGKFTPFLRYVGACEWTPLP
jgi:hypothetical protein